MVLLSFAVAAAASILGVTAQSSSASTSAATATTTAALAVPTSFAGTDWTYAGCYADTAPTGQTHVLTSYIGSSTTQKQETCVTLCNAGGWGYAGLEYGAQCLCGNTLPSTSTKLSEAECNYPCAGDSTGTSKCGGVYKMTLFQNQVLLAAAASVVSSSSAASTSASATSTSIRSSTTSSPAARTSSSVTPTSASSSMVTMRSSSRAVASSSSAVSASASASAVAAGSTVNAAAKSSAGPIAGGVVGGLAALAAIVVVFFLCKRKRSRNANSWADRPRSSFVGGSVGGGSGGGGWTRGASTEDHDGLTGGGSLGVGAGIAGVGARNAGRKEHPSYDDSEKIGLDEFSVVPLTSSQHPANAYTYQQESQPAFAAPPPPSHQSHPNFGTPPPAPVEYLHETTPASSSPTSSYPVFQNASSQYPGVPPRRPSEASSSGSHAPASGAGPAGVSLGRVVSVTKANRKPVPAMAPEDDTADAYDGLAYDAPAPPVPRTSNQGTASPSGRMSGGEWAGAKEMRAIPVDAPSPVYTP